MRQHDVVHRRRGVLQPWIGLWTSDEIIAPRPGTAPRPRPRWTDIVAILPARSQPVRRTCYQLLADVVHFCCEVPILQVAADIAQQPSHHVVGYCGPENRTWLSRVAVDPIGIDESMQKRNFF